MTRFLSLLFIYSLGIGWQQCRGLVAGQSGQEAWPVAPPLLNQNCPDPGIMYNNFTSEWNLVCTDDNNLNGGRFPIFVSTSRVPEGAVWRQDSTAFEHGVAFGMRDWWAPELHHLNDVGVTVLIYTVRSNLTKKLVIAMGWKTEGMKYFKHYPVPIVACSWVGVIDAHIVPSNQTTLVYKLDGNDVGHPSVLYAVDFRVELLGDNVRVWVDGKDAGLSHQCDGVELLRSEEEWEYGVVEAPWIHRVDNVHYLFYSIGVYSQHSYATAVAISTSGILGPYKKLGAPILYSRKGAPPLLDWPYQGPGHGCVVLWNNHLYFVYHAWSHSVRVVLADKIHWVSLRKEKWPIVWRGNPFVDPNLFENIPLWTILLQHDEVPWTGIVVGFALASTLYLTLVWRAHSIPTSAPLASLGEDAIRQD